MAKTFKRARTQSNTKLDSLNTRYQPIYDNSFDDLIEKLNKIDLKKSS